MRQLLEEWKAAPRGDRTAETALWKRLSAARNAFTKRRKAYFAGLEEEREGIRARKEELAGQAEALADSTDWAATAAAYRELMRAWKQAGRADRATEDELWDRFKTAQDTFFQARVRRCWPPRTPSCSRTPWPRSSCWPRRRSCCRSPTPARRAGRAARHPGALGAGRGGPPRLAATGWRAACAGSRSRCARPRTRTGAGPTPRPCPGPGAPWSRSARPSPSWRTSWPRPRPAATPSAQQRAEEALAARQSWLAEAERTLAEFSG